MILALLLLPAMTAGAVPTPRVAILELAADAVEVETAWAIEGLLHEELARTGRVDVLPAHETKLRLEAAGRTDGPCFAPECRRQASEILGVELVVTGRLSRTGRDLLLELETWDTVTGRRLHADALDGFEADALRAQAPAAAARIVEALGPEPPANEPGIVAVARAATAPASPALANASAPREAESRESGGRRKWIWIGSLAAIVAGGAALAFGGG